MPKPIKMTRGAEPDYFELAKEYDLLREQAKSLKKRQDIIATQLKDYAMLAGNQDDKGSFRLENEYISFGSQSKRSVKFKETAIDWFKKRGFQEAIIVTESIDTKAVEKLIDEGTITVADLEAQTEVSQSYSIEVKIKSEMPVIQEETVAASRKPPSLFGKRKS